MPALDRGGTPPPLRDEADRLLLERLRRVAWIVLAALPVYTVADYAFDAPAPAILQIYKLTLAGVCVGVWWAARRDHLRRHARLLGIILVAAISVLSAASSNVTSQYSTHAFMSAMMTLFGAALAPWGAVTQLLAVLIVAATVLWNVRVVTGAFGVLLGYPAITVGVTWMISVYVAWLLDHSRRVLALENFERGRAEALLREEAATSAALAGVGEELIANVNHPGLLERVSHLTVHTLGCDCSWTVLRQGNEDVYVVAAHAGFTPEESAAIGGLTIPAAALAGWRARLDREDVIQTDAGEAEAGMAAWPGHVCGGTIQLHAGLRRGAELVGFHAAAYRRAEKPFSSQQQRLMRGIANLASMALETARLLAELDRANRFKSDFVATMSHELRTPLHVIIGYDELLLDGAFGALTPEQSETLQRTDQRARELLDLINATLDLSRLDAAPATIHTRDVRVAELFDDLAYETTALSQQPHLQWTWHADPGLPLLRTDPVKLRMVLKNLVQNAIKFTPEGSISVAAHANGDGVEFEVADTGVGIPAAAQAHIFEPFFQAETVGQPRGGAGLGLYIVRRLLDMLGGRISLESAVGRGSVFRVWVPCDAEAQRAA